MVHSRNPRDVCYPCSFNCSVFLTRLFFIKGVVGHKEMGKKDKLSIRHSQILLRFVRFVRQVARGVACHAMFTAK